MVQGHTVPEQVRAVPLVAMRIGICPVCSAARGRVNRRRMASFSVLSSGIPCPSFRVPRAAEDLKEPSNA